MAKAIVEQVRVAADKTAEIRIAIVESARDASGGAVGKLLRSRGMRASRDYHAKRAIEFEYLANKLYKSARSGYMPLIDANGNYMGSAAEKVAKDMQKLNMKAAKHRMKAASRSVSPVTEAQNLEMAIKDMKNAWGLARADAKPRYEKQIKMVQVRFNKVVLRIREEQAEIRRNQIMGSVRS